MVTIAKRVPFGFKGLWGKVYKQYNYEQTATDVVQWKATAYADIGQDVQFKLMERDIDKQTFPTQQSENLVVKSNYRIVQTTDAYFDDATGQFRCVAALGDVVFLLGEWWTVDSIDSRNVYTPNMQTFFYVALKKITDKIVRLGG